MKFSEYLASYITPQMTLLEKFNALCKFVEEQDVFKGTKLYLHDINIGSGTNAVNLLFLDTSNKEYTIAEITGNSLFFRTKIFLPINIIGISYSGSTITVSYSSGSTRTITSSSNIANQSVSEYES